MCLGVYGVAARATAQDHRCAPRSWKFNAWTGRAVRSKAVPIVDLNTVLSKRQAETFPLRRESPQRLAYPGRQLLVGGIPPALRCLLCPSRNLSQPTNRNYYNHQIDGPYNP